MKKILALILVVMFVLAFSCKEPLPPTVSVEPANYAGVPSVIAFQAGSVFEDAETEALGYDFTVLSLADSADQKSYHSKDGKVSIEFGRVGEYRLKVKVGAATGPAGESDATGNIIEIPIKIENPFANAIWSLQEESIYQGQELALNTAPVQASKYFWKLYKDDTEIPFWTGETKDSSLAIKSPKINEVGSYRLVLLVEDIYQNAFQFEDAFTVVSESMPIAKAGVYEISNKDGEEIKTLISVRTGEQPRIYAGLPLVLSSEGSFAGSDEGTTLKVERIFWDITFNNFITRVEVAEIGDLDWIPLEVGSYEFKMTIGNELGLNSFVENTQESPFKVLVSPNVPVVRDFMVISSREDGKIYEGLGATLRMTAVSPSDLEGKITTVVIDFDDIPDVVYSVPEEKMDSSFEIPWTIIHKGSSNENITYAGSVYAINKAGEKSSLLSIIIPVLDNDPIPVITAIPSKLFWGETVELSSIGSASPDGNVVSPEIKLYDGNVELELLNGNRYEFATGSGDKEYIAKSIMTNINGTKEVSTTISVSEVKSIANFGIPYLNPELPKYFADQRVLLDAIASQVLGGGIVRSAVSADCTWEIKFNDNAYASTASPNARLFKDATLAKADLQLGLPGIYSISLTVDGNIQKEEIVVVGNMPENIEINRAQLEEGVDESNKRVMKYQFTATASSPDGSPLLYTWYNNKLPVEGVVADKEGQASEFSYRGGEQVVYVVVENAGGTAIAVANRFTSADFLPPAKPVVLAINEITANLKPEFRITPADASDITKYRVQFNGEGNWEETLTEFDDVNTKVVIYRAKTGFSVPVGTERTISLYVQASDDNENWSESAFATSIIDKKPPISPIVSSDYINNLTNELRPSFKWMHEEASDVVNYRYKMSVEADSDWIETSEIFGEMNKDYESGGYEVFVQAQDLAGNWSESGSYVMEIDLLPPEPPVFAETASETNDKTPNWSWNSGSDDTTFYRYQLGAQEEAGWKSVSSTQSSYISEVELEDGTYILFLQSGDDAGNWSASVTGPVKVDTVAPDAVSLSVDKVWTNGMEATWNWTGSADSVAYRSKIQEGEAPAEWNAETVATTFKATLSNESPYRLTIQTRDSAGNWSADSAVICNVDRTAPLAPMVNASKIVFTYTFNATISSTEEEAVYAYKLGDETGSPDNNTDGWSVLSEAEGGLAVPTVATAPGSYSLYSKVRDRAGNWSNATSTQTLCGVPVASATLNSEYNYAAAIILPRLIIAGVDITSLGTTNESTTIDSRKGGIYNFVLDVTDSEGATARIEQAVTIKTPPNPVVVNGDFESSIGSNVTGWQWKELQGYGVQGAWDGWLNPPQTGDLNGSSPTYGDSLHGGYYNVLLGAVANYANNTFFGAFNISKHSLDSAPSKAAFIPQNGMSYNGYFQDNFITRIRGFLVQRNIAVFKDVTYTLKGLSYLQTTKNRSMFNALSVEGAGVEKTTSKVETPDIWGEHSVDFTPTQDGVITIEYEKSDIADGGERDSGGSYFDETSIVVKDYPRVN